MDVKFDGCNLSVSLIHLNLFVQPKVFEKFEEDAVRAAGGQPARTAVAAAAQFLEWADVNLPIVEGSQGHHLRISQMPRTNP